MRKVDDGKKSKEKKKKKMLFLVATTSLPAVNRLNANRWNATRSRQKKKKRMLFLVATTSLPAVYRPNDDTRMTTGGTPHDCAKSVSPLSASLCKFQHRPLITLLYDGPPSPGIIFA